MSPRSPLIPVALALCAVAGAALAAGRGPVTVAGLVDRYLEHTGGRDAFEAEQTTRVKGRVTSSGMSGTFEQWTMKPDKILTRVRLGPLHLQTGYDGTVGWRTDLASKKVTILDGKDLEALKAEAWFENERWAERGNGGGRLTLGTTSFGGSRQYRALEIVPPVGPSRRLWFDVASGRLDRVVSRRDQHEWQQWVGGWRATGARQRWSVQTTRPPRDEDELEIASAKDLGPHDERMIADSLWSDPPLDPAMFSPPSLTAKTVRWQKADGRVAVPFRYGTRHVWIKASIGGAPPADFLLDTGCSITAIDRDYADRIGLTAEGRLAVQGIAGSGEGAFARVKTIRVGDAKTGVTVRDLKVGLIELGEGFEAIMWRPAAGLIGYDFLSHFVVEIDYDAEIVTFHDPKTYTPRPGAEPIPMRLFSGIPTVEVSVNGACAGEFVVDVGNGFALDVHGSMVRRCRLLDAVARKKQVEVYSGGIGGASVNWFCRLDEVRIGSHRWREPIVGLSLAGGGLRGSQDYSGNIGNGVLERFVVTFDYERRRLYLEPGRRFAERDRLSRSGAFLARLSDRVLPAQIMRGSAADEAGLKLRDRIVSIDGKPAATFTPEEIDRLFVDGAEGKQHTLVVERDGVTRKLTLTLRDIL